MTINPVFVVAKGFWVSVLLLSFTTLCAQNQTIHAVFAGSGYTNSDYGMQRNDYVYYFRPDGAFCSQLDNPGWQKKTSGTYTIDGNRLRMKFLSDGAEKVILLSVTGETGQSGSITFIKMDLATKVPTGLFKYTRSNGKQDALFFHESGRFGHSRFDPSVTAVARGKKGKSNNGEGFYTLSQSVLTMQYDNGRTETQSFFYSLDKTPIAVIDGKIYYGEEDKNLAKQGPEQTTGTATEVKNENNGPQTATANEASTAMIIMQSANLAHGGKFLDNINTMKAVMNTNNLTITMQADLQQQYLRMESAIDNNTILVEQLEGSTGWSYDGSGYTSLSPQRIREMQHTLFCGQLGLRSDVLSKSTVTLQKQQSGLSSVMVQMENIRAGYIINNNNNRLEALILAGDNNATSSITYSDYKKIDNILLPFTETIQSGNHTQTITYDKYSINPKLSKEDWAKP